jgi:endonuclease/exonuclease/phosphatase family metal-dependent hydrolase
MNSSLSFNQSITYKILFWNILCDEYSYDWKTAPKIELKYKVWEYRKGLFTSFLSSSQTYSDIYAFIEVDKQDDIFQIINSQTQTHPSNLYQMIYYPRPNTPLGIMLVYNKYKFSLYYTRKIIIGEHQHQNFALSAVFQELFAPYNYFCVVVTHLTAWDKNENIRIKQVQKLMHCLKNDNAIEQYKIKNIILCGDFNTGPYSECVSIVKMNEYKSVFDNFDKDNQEYTMVIDTMDEGIKKLKFDYMFTKGNVNVVKKLLPKEYLDFENGMPNEKFPSDHLFLKMEFGFGNK